MDACGDENAFQLIQIDRADAADYEKDLDVFKAGKGVHRKR